MNPNDCSLYAGIAGVSINIDEFDFGEGVVLRKTYAHVMAPYLGDLRLPSQANLTRLPGKQLVVE
jgi:hypothetical protein